MALGVALGVASSVLGGILGGSRAKKAEAQAKREAARLQTFDDDFEFLGSRGDQYKMIGNAVPPKFSKLIAEIVIEILNEKTKSVELCQTLHF